MIKEAAEAREKAEAEREEAIRKRREEREKPEEKIEEGRSGEVSTDTVEISEEGKVLLKDNFDLDNADSDGTKEDVIKKPVTYTKTGNEVPAKPGVSIIDKKIF